MAGQERAALFSSEEIGYNGPRVGGWLVTADERRQNMRSMNPLAVAALAAALLAPTLAQAAESGADPTPWRISGQLSEACTCSVPCTCNFGQGPSPSHTCWALFSLDIGKGRYGKVDLKGLRLGGAVGPKGIVGYIDDRATPQQAQALQAIMGHVGESVLKQA